MSKISTMIRDVRIVYGKRLLSFLAVAFIVTFPSVFRINTETLKSVYGNTVGFFTALIVIEIAFFGIFYSGSQINKEAKNKLFNIEENMSYYQRLLIKNYHSIFIKFTTIFLAYLSQMYNVMELCWTYGPFEKFNIPEIKLGVYYVFYMLAIYSIVVTIDLVTTVYYFLWRS